MLSQERVDELLRMPKALEEKKEIEFPRHGLFKSLKATSEDGREEFLIDINRKGTIRLTKCTFQNRYAVVEILLRLDIDGPPHENPDGQVIPCPHLHIYREGAADKWAIPLPAEFSDPTNLPKTLRDFLEYCKVKDIPAIQGSI